MPKKRYLRTLLMQRFHWIEERVVERAVANGYDKVTPAMARMFGHMGGQPIGLSDLARCLGISRQAVHKLANDAAALELIEFVPCPNNARVVRLQFSPAGWAMSAQAAKDFDRIEEQLKARIGAKNLAELKRLLSLPWDESDEETPDLSASKIVNPN